MVEGCGEWRPGLELTSTRLEGPLRFRRSPDEAGRLHESEVVAEFDAPPTDKHHLRITSSLHHGQTSKSRVVHRRFVSMGADYEALSTAGKDL